MQIQHPIAFAFPNKHRLLIPPAAAATPPTSMTSLQRIKDVIKHHQSQTRSYGRTRTREPPPTLEAREPRRALRLSSQTQEPWRPVSSRQVKGWINRSGSEGVILGLPAGPLGRVKAGCCFLCRKLERWHNEVQQRDLCFSCAAVVRSREQLKRGTCVCVCCFSLLRCLQKNDAGIN